MLKIMKPDEDNEPFIVEDERGVKRKVYYEQDDDVFIFAGGPLGGGSYDDLDEFDGILPDLDRTIEDCQIALERLRGKRARALRDDHLALYLALETKVAQLSGYVGIIDADDAEQEDDPTSLVVRSLTRLWLPETLERFGYAYALAPSGDGLYFSVGLEGGYAFDFSAAAAACDAVDPQLGPSLLTQLRLHTPLTPASTPEVCRDYLAAFYWEGSDDAENLLYLARDDLAYAQGVDEALLDDAGVAAYADSHYFTPGRVDRLIERRYTDLGHLTLKDCLSLCRRHALPNLIRVCELLYALRSLAERLPAASRDVLEAGGGSEPFAALISLPRSGAEDDLVDEVYREYESSVWQGGEFSPVYALELKPDDPASLSAFKTALAVAKRSFELTDELYRTLEVTTCLFP